jgi:hypothetical protein
MVAEASNPLLAAALAYARRGWPVLPLHAAEKSPDGWLVPHGLKDATTDEDLVRSWWAASPRANVGIATGRGIDVIDIDSPAARTALMEISPEPLAPSHVVRTGRGWHLWYSSSGLQTRTGALEGIDVRGVGGYVVAPPSLHPQGQRYAFLDEANGELLDVVPEGPLGPAPPWLIERLRPATRVAEADRQPVRLRSDHYVRVAVDSECAAVASTPDGSRNDRLNRAAFSLGTLVGADVLDAEEARARLLDAALRSGLGEREARRTIASGLEAGERQPRRTAEALQQGPEARRDGERQPERQDGRQPERVVRRSPDPSRRPDESATDAVLARARHPSTTARSSNAPTTNGVSIDAPSRMALDRQGQSRRGPGR